MHTGTPGFVLERSPGWIPGNSFIFSVSTQNSSKNLVTQPEGKESKEPRLVLSTVFFFCLFVFNSAGKARFFYLLSLALPSPSAILDFNPF